MRPDHEVREVVVDKEAYLWRIKSIYRCLRGLVDDRASLADRGALLREICRLADGHISLPYDGIGVSEGQLLSLDRFGLKCNFRDDRVNLLLSNDEELADSIKSALRLDPYRRRHYATDTPDAMLLRLTPHKCYQSPTQKASIRALVSMPPASTLCVTMPTGSGKSLLFQLGTLWERTQNNNSCALIIVPTVSLAQDHERALRNFPGLEGSRALTGEYGVVEREKILSDFNRGLIPILLLSPEMALGYAYDHLLTAAKALGKDKPSAARGRLTTFYIDEAHIVESWGRSFRPDFQRLPALVSALRRHNPELRVVLLSATLTEQARQELYRAYSGTLPPLDINARAPRYEFDMVFQTASSDRERDDAILRLADIIPRPCLIYTTRVEHARQLYDRLRAEKGFKRIALFTGEVSDAKVRRQIVDDWSRDRLDVVVATSAFGLGIDKDDVRAVVHACVPESPARYYQEIGRASRDGHQGLALCVWHRSESPNGEDDLSRAYGQATRQWLKVETARSRWYAIVNEITFAGGAKIEDGRRYLSVPLDAARESLGGESSDYNRIWNMTLLNLLQRAGAIEITIEVDADAPVWRVELKEPRLLQDDDAGRQYLERVLNLREEEKKRARRDVDALKEVFTNSINDCALSMIFNAVETKSTLIDECGLCPWCRSMNARPPSEIAFRGVDQHWNEPAGWSVCELTAGRTIIHPEDGRFENGFSSLLKRLAGTGIEQYIVPKGLGSTTAQLLKDSCVRCGLVLESDRLIDNSGWTIANLPTALLIEDKAEPAHVNELYDWFKTWTDSFPSQPLLIVVSAFHRLYGRSFVGVASKGAPYHEKILDDWALMRGARR